jgi:succinate dehydrogenase/fumarate reductase flavoprotein subunit
MCEAAPAIIDLLDRMGVTFNRTPEGLLDFRRFGGTLYNRTAFAGATTGQQFSMPSTSRCAATSPKARSKSTKAGSFSPR